MIPRIVVTAVLAFALGWVSCFLLFAQNRTNQIDANYPIIEEYKIQSYPHVDSQILKRITQVYPELKIGMSKAEVYSLLGKPHEVRYLYEPCKNSKKVGYSIWYVDQRMKAVGSVNDKDEKLLRICFNFEDVSTAIDHWGFDLHDEADQAASPNP